MGEGESRIKKKKGTEKKSKFSRPATPLSGSGWEGLGNVSIEKRGESWKRGKEGTHISHHRKRGVHQG